jgi:putative peptide zinc metalloprotease protein
VFVLIGLLFFLPVPYATKAEGIVSLGDDGRVVSGASGFVANVVSQPGSTVKTGEVLLALDDAELDATIRLLQFELQEFNASYSAVNLYDRVQADILKEQIARTKAKLKYYRQRQVKLAIRASSDGKFVLLSSSDIQGRYVTEGTVVGYVMPAAIKDVQVVVPGDQVSLVSDDTLSVEIRAEGAVEKVIGAAISRQAPSALVRLPSLVLTANGGGKIAVDPQSANGLEPLENYYQFDLVLNESIENTLVDGRVYVRFLHSSKPLGLQWFRAARQTFLSILDV